MNNLIQDRAEKLNQRLSPTDTVELLAQYNAAARYAAEHGQMDVHDTWHRAMDLMLSMMGTVVPAPCFCEKRS